MLKNSQSFSRGSIFERVFAHYYRRFHRYFTIMQSKFQLIKYCEIIQKSLAALNNYSRIIRSDLMFPSDYETFLILDGNKVWEKLESFSAYFSSLLFPIINHSVSLFRSTLTPLLTYWTGGVYSDRDCLENRVSSTVVITLKT